MSTNLYWEPAYRKKKDAGDTGLKHALQKRHGYPVDVILNDSDIGYLTGLTDAGTDASKLIEAIEKHEEIHVTEA